MTSPFEEIVDLRVRYHEAQVRKAAHDIETLQNKARGIPLSVDVRQESFRRAAAQLDAATKLRTATVKVDVDDRHLNNTLSSLRKSFSDTKFTVDLDKTGFENKIRDLELKREILAGKFRDGFKTKLDADAAFLSMNRLQHEADSLHNKLARLRNERINIDADQGGFRTLTESIKQAAISASSLRSVVHSLPAPVLAGAVAFGILTGSVLATGAAVGLTVAGVGALAAAALSSTTRVKNAFGTAAAEIRVGFTDAVSVLIPTFERIASKTRILFADLNPSIQHIAAKTGPLLNALVDGVGAAIRRVTPSIDNLVSKSGPLIDSLAKGMVTIAGAVSNVLDRMGDSSRGAGEGVELLADGVGHVLNGFGELVTVANTVSGAIGAVKDTVGLLTGAIPIASKHLDAFTESVGLAFNPVKLLTESVGALDEGMRKFAPKPITVTIKGKALADPNVKPEDLFKQATKGEFFPGLQAAIKRDIDGIQEHMKEALRNAELSNIGGRFRAVMDMSPAQGAVQHVQSLRAAWVSSAQAVSDAETRVSQVSAQNAAAVTEATRGIASAETSLRDAQANTRQAQQDLNQARRDAALDISNMRAALRDLGDNEEAALIRLERAKLAAQEAALAKGQEFTQDQLNARARVEQDLRRRETLLEVKNAEENLHDVRAAGQQTRAEYAEAERRGIENHPIVMAAKQQLAAALNNEKSAQDQLIEANWRLEQVQRENKARMDEVSAALAEQRAKTNEQEAAYSTLLRMLGLTDAQVLLYGQHLKELPGVIDQFIKLHGLEEVLAGSARLSLEIDAQRLMAENPGMSPEQAVNEAGRRHVQRKLDNQLYQSLQPAAFRAGHGLQSRKDGGPIHGPGDGRSDSVPIMASTGEFMQPTDAVQHYGTGFMEAIRKKKLPKFADGGSIGYDWNVDMKRWAVPEMMRRSDIVKRARDNAQAYFAPTLGLGSSTEHSYPLIHQVAKKFDPNAVMTSGLRNTQDNHGKGLAADFVGNMGAIARGFFGIKESLLQLIHSGSGGFFVAQGRQVDGPGYYGNEVGNHFDHVHVAARKDAMQAVLGGAAGVPPGSGVERWRATVNQALGIVGQPLSMANSTLRRMHQESGGQHDIVNKWDSNWTAGTPSVGLMQVIGPTYAANKHPQYDNGPYMYGSSINPLSNVLASMRYALRRYGSLPAAYDRPGGYKDGGLIFDEGGMLPTGATVVNNQTGRPEPLVNAANDISLSTATIMQLARILAQVLNNRPAMLTLPDGRVLAETVSDAILGEATVPGVSF